MCNLYILLISYFLDNHSSLYEVGFQTLKQVYFSYVRSYISYDTIFKVNLSYATRVFQRQKYFFLCKLLQMSSFYPLELKQLYIRNNRIGSRKNIQSPVYQDCCNFHKYSTETRLSLMRRLGAHVRLLLWFYGCANYSKWFLVLLLCIYIFYRTFFFIT